MTENDYIAEYIKDKYPSLLGIDYTMWKFVKQLGNVAHDIVKTFERIPFEDLSRAVEDTEGSEE